MRRAFERDQGITLVCHTGLFSGRNLVIYCVLQILQEYILNKINLFLSALPKEYQKIGKALQNLALVFTTSGYQGIFILFFFGSILGFFLSKPPIVWFPKYGDLFTAEAQNKYLSY